MGRCAAYSARTRKWWNGRHASLRSWCPRGREGSSPSFRTTLPVAPLLGTLPAMDLGLNGRVAVVGGGSSGLGLAAARRLAQEGCDLLVWARDEARVRDVAASLAAETGRRIEALAADASSP